MARIDRILEYSNKNFSLRQITDGEITAKKFLGATDVR